MHEAHTPLFFHRNSYPLRAVMIDNQPWFVAVDFARMIGALRPYRLPQRMDPYQKRWVLLEYGTGLREELEVISDAGAYKALYRFNHPEHRNIGRWLSEAVLPTLYDHHRDEGAAPKRAFMSWANQQVHVLKWQGEIWLARGDLPVFLAVHDEPALRELPSWKRMPLEEF
ncbi:MULTISPECIES: BRO-N domain-containing protein [Pseudomonas]|uniref:BRO-N domain-containing protein n=1 Tax=Pseudomonas TaxID=286 RepID=UPI001BD043DF|nr:MULTISPECIES: BRO family protein [Pseudomonas]UXY55676.1 BRO family protein [Pseudomonas tohonis]BBP83277.1 hypothetical protein PHLH8_29190 [Pseudomonas sp. Pc102]